MEELGEGRGAGSDTGAGEEEEDEAAGVGSEGAGVAAGRPAGGYRKEKAVSQVQQSESKEERRKKETVPCLVHPELSNAHSPPLPPRTSRRAHTDRYVRARHNHRFVWRTQ